MLEIAGGIILAWLVLVVVVSIAMAAERPKLDRRREARMDDPWFGK